MDGGRFRRRRRGSVADRESGRGMVRRRSGCRLCRGRTRARRDLRRPLHRTPSDGNPQRDGVLAERQAVSALLDAKRGPHRGRRGEVGGDRAVAGGPDQRVHGRRLRQQGRRIGDDGDSGAAVEEGGRAGDDARQPRGGELLRPRAHEHGRPREDGLRQGWPHHRPRSVHRAGRRSVRADGRPPLGGARRVAGLSAGRDAVAGGQRAHQHAAALAAAIPRTDAGQRHRRAGRDQGRQATWTRPGRHPAAQLARRQGPLRPGRGERAASLRDRRVREAGARSRCRALRLADARRPIRVSAAAPRCAGSASPWGRTARDPWATTA